MSPYLYSFMQKISEFIEQELLFHGYDKGQSKVTETHNWMRWVTNDKAQNLPTLLATSLNFDMDHQDNCQATQLDFENGLFFIRFMIDTEYPSKIFNLCQDTYDATLLAAYELYNCEGVSHEVAQIIVTNLQSLTVGFNIDYNELTFVTNKSKHSYIVGHTSAGLKLTRKDLNEDQELRLTMDLGNSMQRKSHISMPPGFKKITSEQELQKYSNDDQDFMLKIFLANQQIEKERAALEAAEKQLQERQKQQELERQQKAQEEERRRREREDAGTETDNGGDPPPNQAS